MSDFEEHGTNIAIGSLYVWVGIGIFVMAMTLIMALRPAWIGMERDAFTESHQYVESHKDKLLGDIAEYDELEAEIAKYEAADGDNARIVDGLRMQQKSLKERIRSSLAKIPPDYHPPNVERFK